MMDLITNINRMPRLGETIEAPDFDLGFGGKGANQAVAASKIGSEVVMVSKVGDGLFGKEVIQNFDSYGINTEYVKIVENTTSGVAPIFVDQDGNNRILIVKGANAHLKPADVEQAKDKIIDSNFILLQLEIPLETVYYCIDFGVENDIPVILNPAPAAELDFDYVKKASIFVPNETELETITKMPVDNLENIKKAAQSLLTQELEKIIVTMGEKGSLLVSKEITELVPAHRVDTKDTTGAGDAFIGSFATFYAETDDILKAMEMANKYAALSTLNTGTQKSFYSREEFEKNID
mgnify:CR=1 FL=1